MLSRALTLWGSTLAAGAYIGYTLPPFALLRRLTEEYLPDRHKDPLGTRMYTKLIESEMMGLPLVKSLKSDKRYEMSRAWESLAPTIHEEAAAAVVTSGGSQTQVDPTPETQQQQQQRTGKIFTAHTLSVPGGMSAPPLIFTDHDTQSTIIIVHVGRKLTGFPMIVHGGILATLLDEALGRTAFLGFPGGVGVTANLQLQYKAPSIAHQFLVIRTQCEAVNDKKTKAVVKGTVETLKGKLLVKSSAVFVVPKRFRLKRLEGF